MSPAKGAVKPRAIARPTYSVEQLTARPRPGRPWREYGLGLIALAVLLGCLAWMGAGGQYALGAVLALVLSIDQVVRGLAAAARAQREAAALTQVMQQLAFPVTCAVTWAGGAWRSGHPTKVVADYPPIEATDRTVAEITAAVNAAWAPTSFRSEGSTRPVGNPRRLRSAAARVGGVLGKLRCSGPNNRVVLFAYTAETPEGERTPLEALRAQIDDRVEQLLGTEAKIVDVATEGNQVTEFVVSHRYGPRLVDDRVQIALGMAMSQMLEGQWGATFDLVRDLARFSWRRPLPKLVPVPVDPELPSDAMIPLGQDEDGEYAIWDFNGLFAHLLISGRTRTGKSVLMRTVLMLMCRLGHRVFVIDPKRIEFNSLRDWPNVEMVASKVEDQLALLKYLRELMMERYRLIEEEGYLETDFERVVVIIDEYKQFVSNVQSWWRQNKATGMPAQCPMIDYVGDLLRLAAAARIHIVLGTQRPDAETVGGEALAVDTPIPTPNGWTTMGELAVGDHVFGPDGQPVRVTNVTDVMHAHPCYRVQFSDGSHIVADAGHLWQVSTPQQRTPYPLRSREERWPKHTEIAEHLNQVTADQLEQVVTVGEFEQMVNQGRRFTLLRRAINKGTCTAPVIDTIPSVKGRWPARRYRAGDLVEQMSAQLAAPAPTWRRRHEVMTTEQLARSLADNPTSSYSIPLAAPVEYPAADLPVDPWLLGYWLGDGHKATATIATADDEVLQRIQQLGFRTPHYARFNYGVVLGHRGQHQTGNLKTVLRDLGLLHNKHVPDRYLTSSVHQRREVLAGLLDSDGTVSLRSRPGGPLSGQVVFTNTNRQLVDSVAQLAASLGFMPTIREVRREVETGPNSVCLGSRLQTAWKVSFTPNRQVFGIGRKQRTLDQALQAPRRATTRNRYIIAVEPVESVPVRCITVDSQDHLYLAGHSFIATHNCRDNFSARCSTGSLSPDGAKMMFDNERIGVAVPKIQGRGYFAGTDDRPQQIQYFWTPNPRTATNAEDKAKVELLRPQTTAWSRKVWSYLDDEAVRLWQAQQADQGTEIKGSLPWLKVLSATLTAPTPHDATPADETEQTVTDDGDGFGEEVMLCPSAIQPSDLIAIDSPDGHEWATVNEVRVESSMSVWISWTSDTDDGLISTNDEVPMRVRQPLPFDEPND